MKGFQHFQFEVRKYSLQSVEVVNKMASENNNCNGEDNAVQEMTDKMSSATFGDAGDQGHASEREEFDQSVDDKLGDSMMDFDNVGLLGLCFGLRM